MTIASEITRINNNIAAAYTAASGKGATMPATQNSANLATTIGSLPIFYTNYEIKGSPTINTQTGIAENFSTSDYLQVSKSIPYQPTSFEIKLCFTTASDISTTQFIYCNFGFSGLVFGLDSGKLLCYGSSDNSAWNILDGQIGTTNLSANTKYWVKLVFDGSNYKCYLSTTGSFNGEETTEFSVASASKITGNITAYIGCQVIQHGNFLPFLGSIDLSDCYIKINGDNFWAAGMIF